MRQLRLVALSDDGAHLILTDDGNEQLALQVDERLHAAIRGDRARLGQLEIQLESQLRPRDIQARVRSGESVESVAAVAGMPRDKVERFAGPVIAERQHIAERARQATVRRPQGDGKPPTLDTAATDSAKAHGVDAATIEWDAWRRDDGRWLVRCSWQVEQDDVQATFSFEPTGRSVTPEDDAARILAGEVLPQATAAPVREAAAPAAVKPSAPVPSEPEVDTEEFQPAALSGPARLSVVSDQPDLPSDVDESRPAAAGDDVGRPRRPSPYGRNERRRRQPEPWEHGNDVIPDDEITSERLRLSDIARNVQVEGPTTAELEQVAEASGTAGPAAQEAEKKPARRSKNKRPSVPSWDEIMFGRRKPD